MTLNWTGAGVLLLLLLLTACSASAPPVREYSTWASLGTVIGNTAPQPAIDSLPPGAWPWAGTVSHHLLANNQIDTWFKILAEARTVDTFFLLSPSHWGLSTQPWSLTDGRWLTHESPVDSDTRKVMELAANLGVELDQTVFDPEHGISTLMPYIKRYFPTAKAVAIAYKGEPPVNMPLAQRLEQALRTYFDLEGRRQNFLLLSTDFAHHGDLEGTLEKDARAWRFFRQPKAEDWILVGCDNRPAMYMVARWLRPEDTISVLFHTNSWALSGQESDDITSYFFTLVWSPGT